MWDSPTSMEPILADTLLMPEFKKQDLQFSCDFWEKNEKKEKEWIGNKLSNKQTKNRKRENYSSFHDSIQSQFQKDKKKKEMEWSKCMKNKMSIKQRTKDRKIKLVTLKNW